MWVFLGLTFNSNSPDIFNGSNWQWLLADNFSLIFIKSGTTIKILHLDFLLASHRIPSAVYRLQISALVPEGISTSFPGSSLFLPRESTLVAPGHVSMYTNQIRTGGGLSLNCVKTVYGGENCFASQTLIWKFKQVICQRSCLTAALLLSELLWVWDVDWEGSLLIFTTFSNNRQQPVSD